MMTTAPTYMGYELANGLLEDFQRVDRASHIDARHYALFAADLAPANAAFQFKTLPGYAFWQHNEEPAELMQPWFNASFDALELIQQESE